MAIDGKSVLKKTMKYKYLTVILAQGGSMRFPEKDYSYIKWNSIDLSFR